MSLYNLYNFVSNLTIGGWLSIVIICSLFIEITPFIKINPIEWLGKRLNAYMNKRVDKIEKKLDEHIAQSYRTKILDFQDSLLKNPANYRGFTKEQYDEVIDSISIYERYCKENKIDNGKCVLAIGFIKQCYEKCQTEGSFSSLPIDNN